MVMTMFAHKKTVLIIFCLLLALTLGGSREDVRAQAAPSDGKLSIVFTHDLHSYFLPHEVFTGEGQPASRGGYARMARLIEQQRALKGKDMLLVDAGDFSMGTLFHTTFMTEATELRLMGEMGFDVTTFGNHDFDFHNDGLAAMLRIAGSKGGRLPAIVASNIVFSGDAAENALKEAFRQYPVKDYIVLERNGLRIGLFGLMGKDAAHDAPFARPVTFADPVTSARRVVEILKNTEKVDVIVCLSHSGTSAVKKHSEDEILAREVPGIDVIISGHTHTVLPRPIVIGKAIIVSAGRYGEFVGILDLDYTKDKGMSVAAYELKSVTADLPDDPQLAADILKFKRAVDQVYLKTFGFAYDQVVAESDFHLEPLSSIYVHPREAGLGNMITDAYRYAVEKAEGNNYQHIHLVIDPLGLIRDSFRRGRITVADVFQVLSLGLGMDGVAGYPLTAVYITGDEMKDLLEVHTSVATRKTDAHFQLSGIRLTYNPHRLPFDRITEVLVREADSSYRPLDPGRRYRICMNIYTAKMVEFVQRASHGLIRLTPKDRDGRTISDINNARIDADPLQPGIQELKEWVALASYMKSFPDTDGNGVANIPDKYSRTEGRITAAPSWNPLRLIAGGNRITCGVLAAAILILGLLGWLLWKIRRKMSR
ncbi:MAG: bifunctional metallophosphatase/5'-nucleotidase [Syntrophus sp. (in: bacteria)]|nr:bifunctional metallophosphatase/5'-nucleotidase [Syntrophus sp. (in: bacteria)]